MSDVWRRDSPSRNAVQWIGSKKNTASTSASKKATCDECASRIAGFILQWLLFRRGDDHFRACDGILPRTGETKLSALRREIPESDAVRLKSSPRYNSIEFDSRGCVLTV